MNHPLLIGNRLARDLVQDSVDTNEFAKTVAHLRVLLRQAESQEHQRKQLASWWRWLKTIVDSGAKVVRRSKQTPGYYQAILANCQRHLHDQDLEPGQVLQALGWAARLMHYYTENRDPRQWPKLCEGTIPPTPLPKRAPAAAARPAQSGIPHKGQRFNNITVCEVHEKGIVVDLNLELPDGLRVVAGIHSSEIAGKRYQPGARLNAEVVEVEQRQEGTYRVFLRPIRKEKRS
ncbi:MAG: hypothetical protein KatS3mg057_1152 [Herpetosiphonaceae bacterium]|nr:MAG: hypothetical protein KatS3mg057_1152 [Herpetosiphonaceae bacterium]